MQHIPSSWHGFTAWLWHNVGLFSPSLVLIMVVLIRSCLILFTLLFAQAIIADEFAELRADYEQDQSRHALRGIKHLARDNNAEAQYYLGLLMFNGQGVNQDVEQGLVWMKKAAENGLYSAAAELGQIYLSGTNVAVNHEQAAKWIQLSTEIADPKEVDVECD